MVIQVPYPVIDMSKTGENIKRLRIERNISVTDIQNFLGLTTSQAIYQWQAGITLPSVDNLLALSHLFQVSMNDILVLEQMPLRERSTLIPHSKRVPNLAQRVLMLAAA